jgi:hypothetical protein
MVVAIALLLAGCSTHRPPRTEWNGAATPDRIVAALDTLSRPAESYRASLFLTIEGGFLDEDEVRIHGQLAERWPEDLRLQGHYGAMRRLFDLGVRGERFELLDHRDGVLYRGDAFDPESAIELGFALRPGDLARLLRLGGAGPLRAAGGLQVERAGEEILVRFALPGDAAVWEARFASADGRLLRLSRALGPEIVLRVTYSDYFRTGGRWIPRRVAVEHPGGVERIYIEVRSIRLDDDLPDALFQMRVPDDVEVVDLDGAGQKPIAEPPQSR